MCHCSVPVLRVPRTRCARCGHAVRLRPGCVERWYHGMLPQSVIGALASQIGAQLLCLDGIKNIGVQDWAAGHLVDSRMLVLVLPPLLSTGHMAMNGDHLAPGSSVFYLRGTTGERVPATGPWNHFPDENFDQSEVEPNTDLSESSSSSSDDSGDEDGTTCHRRSLRGRRIGVHIYRRSLYEHESFHLYF